MFISGPITGIDLAIAQTARLRDAAGVIVCCISGEVWITQEGDAGDIILGASKQFTITKNGLVLLEALADAKLNFDAL